MKPIKSHWLPLAAAVSLLSVGIPYWLIPYNKLSLPDALLTPGLAVVVASALLLRLFGGASFWRTTFVIGGSVGAVVMARVLADAAHDPTSHNLWPFEVVIALAIGLCCSLAGSIVGNLMRTLLPARSDEERS
jgi:hypothetical protein